MQKEKLVYRERKHGKEFPVGTIILYLKNGAEIASTETETFVYFPCKKWKKEITNRYNNLFKMAFPKAKHNCNVNCEKLMKHHCARKGNGGGKISPPNAMTDYECAKSPLHDFRRNMYVQWN